MNIIKSKTTYRREEKMTEYDRMPCPICHKKTKLPTNYREEWHCFYCNSNIVPIIPPRYRTYHRRKKLDEILFEHNGSLKISQMDIFFQCICFKCEHNFNYIQDKLHNHDFDFEYTPIIQCSWLSRQGHRDARTRRICIGFKEIEEYEPYIKWMIFKAWMENPIKLKKTQILW